MLWCAGCASPPSVAPLLRAADQAVQQEHRLLADDHERRRLEFDRQRDDLAAAFEADLAAQAQLDPQWVAQGVRAYVAAREGLLDHQHTLDEQYATRRDNLATASQAIARAVSLLEQQDQLFKDIPDLRRWLEDINND